jgi:D-lactate dehydrogenase (cytochrome)
LTRNAYVLDQHGKGEAFHPRLPPDVVVFPETTDEVQAIVATCRDLALPIIRSPSIS